MGSIYILSLLAIFNYRMNTTCLHIPQQSSSYFPFQRSQDNMTFKDEGDTKGGALSDPALLDKIDELRRLGVASMVPLPQGGNFPVLNTLHDRALNIFHIIGCCRWAAVFWEIQCT